MGEYLGLYSCSKNDLIIENSLITDQWHRRGLSLHAVLHEVRHDVDRDGEDDGAVVLRRDAVQGLQVTKLRGKLLVLIENYSIGEV